MSHVFIIIPAFNEERCIEAVVRQLRSSYENVVVVSDGSTDATTQAARRGGATVLTHVVNRGQGAALQTGIEFAVQAGAECIVTFDADGQHDAEDIAALIEPIARKECDIVLGSRFLVNQESNDGRDSALTPSEAGLCSVRASQGGTSSIPLGRRITLRLGVAFTRLMSGMRVTDTHNGLRAFSRRAAEKINLKLDRMAHASEILDQIKASGLAYREVPVRVRYTDYSLAKGQSARGAFRIVLHYLLGKVLG